MDKTSKLAKRKGKRSLVDFERSSERERERDCLQENLRSKKYAKNNRRKIIRTLFLVQLPASDSYLSGVGVANCSH